MMRKQDISDFGFNVGWQSPGTFDRLSKWLLDLYGGPPIREISKLWKRGQFKYAFGGMTVSPHLLKDAEFARAPEDSEFYCYITTSDGVTHAKTSYEALRLSCRSERYTASFRTWLEEQDDPIIKNWEGQ